MKVRDDRREDQFVRAAAAEALKKIRGEAEAEPEPAPEAPTAPPTPPPSP